MHAPDVVETRRGPECWPCALRSVTEERDELATIIHSTLDAIDAGELLVAWSPEYVRENGLDSPAANQDHARATLARMGLRNDARADVGMSSMSPAERREYLGEPCSCDCSPCVEPNHARHALPGCCAAEVTR